MSANRPSTCSGQLSITIHGAVAIASAIDELVMTALAKRPGDRYADAAA